MTLLRWLFWHAVYLFRREPRELVPFLLRGERLRPPWRRFRPSVWHNNDGRMWHIYLEDAACYTRANQTLRVELHYAEDDGRVVGFNVFDEVLVYAQRRPYDGSNANQKDGR